RRHRRRDGATLREHPATGVTRRSRRPHSTDDFGPGLAVCAWTHRQQVVHLINGIRFNNSTFRPGANQYTALIDHDFADQVEVVRGPGSTQYGSDSLGGTINVLTNMPQGSDTFGLQGHVNTYFANADL